MGRHLSKIQDWESAAREASFRPSAIAAMCSISLRQLERHFAVRYHKTPGEWSRELRCQLARRFISQGWSNKAVVAELGFTDSSHLCREFKKMCGASPQDFAPIHARIKPEGRRKDVALLQ